jgi:hypothetical protein
MRNKYLTLLLIGLASVIATVKPSLADLLNYDTLVSDKNGINTPNNPQILDNSSESTEEAWLQSLLGVDISSYFVHYIPSQTVGGSILSTNTSGGILGLSYTPPNWDWEYATVKMGRTHFAFQDTFEDNKLVFDFLNDPLLSSYSVKGLSHITFFGKEKPNDPVPEPATMLLFGTGIVGIVGIARRRKNQ